MSRFGIALKSLVLCMALAGCNSDQTTDVSNRQVKEGSQKSVVLEPIERWGTVQEIDKQLWGKPLGEAIKYYKIRYSELTVSDEPPCQASGVVFDVSDNEEILVSLVYSEKLFSKNRNWSESVLSDATVKKIIRIKKKTDR